LPLTRTDTDTGASTGTFVCTLTGVTVWTSTACAALGSPKHAPANKAIPMPTHDFRIWLSSILSAPAIDVADR